MSGTRYAIADVNKPLPWPDSPFANTREGSYVGSAKCIECHVPHAPSEVP